MPNPSRKATRPRGEETRTALIDAAEKLMLDEGYASVTARRVTAEAGLKSLLLHYYFDSIDDLFVAVIRRRAQVTIDRMNATLSAADPLQALWSFVSDEANARLSMEFLAVASHRVAVREEVKRYAEHHRIVQTAAFTRFYTDRGLEPKVPPMAAAMIMTALTQLTHMEAAHGITLGHAELRGFIETAFENLHDLGAYYSRAETNAKRVPAEPRRKSGKA